MRRSVLVALIAAASSIGFLGSSPTARAAAVLTVDTFDDTFDGSCTDADCSLRDAITAVDAGGTVRLPPGFYPLDLAGRGGVEAGDLDVDRPMTLVGVGETGSFLEASALADRVLDLRADVTVRHLSLLGGSTVATGGVVRARTGSIRLDLVTILGGRAEDGGAVTVGPSATASIDRSWISASRAADRGGGLFVRGPTVVSRSTISGNRAVGGGGAFAGASASLTLVDATVSRNTGDRGGGIRAIGDVDISSSTLAGNRADLGGAISLSAVSESSATSSVFDGNDASVRGPTCGRPIASGGHNVADTGGCGLSERGDLAGVEPRIGVLRQNGGPTPTHALHLGSPALGNGAGCGAIDQRGAPRQACDSGSYELVFCLGRPVNIVGTPGPDELSGGLGRDVFLGRGGDDEFQGSLDKDRACGGPGDDHLIGGPDRDRLAGNRGDDRLWGEEGADLLLGGRGVDTCRGGPGRDVSRRCEPAS